MLDQLNIDNNLLMDTSVLLKKNNLTLSMAESCTGGFLSSCLTSLSGSSVFFKGSIISYSNEAKYIFLDIDKKFIEKHNVVSKEIVEKMAIGARKKFNTNYAIATTGYVDPTNLMEPNLLCAWIAVSSHKKVLSKLIMLNGNRTQNISKVSFDLLNLLRKEIV
ncbi:MAG: damage-inducible protein CinA [Flavobacteriales bacterium]|nr:damage-inducible protein CinA [Flavobacteriales bacterium]|tara:strand:- start:850 stop:1338 length:489 start_codon:yes stop_codon:yes gene_type:complete